MKLNSIDSIDCIQIFMKKKKMNFASVMASNRYRSGENREGPSLLHCRFVYLNGRNERPGCIYKEQ